MVNKEGENVGDIENPKRNVLPSSLKRKKYHCLADLIMMSCVRINIESLKEHFS
ncbi:hypothetical protein Sjap_022936 [Stephania japonica]|uniref:Uncharacterized protein n=1 Tax=Stephania japonica TaxID=461633 RepID=A0AAP0HTJ1_9MAGN